ncbi:MAG TPA: hypothetical protein VIZ90_10745 [Rhizobiaceae bacterium]
MSFAATPQQMKLLRKAVDDYCRDCGILDDDERLYVAELATSLFQLGAIDQHNLRRGLDDAMGACQPQRSGLAQ